MGRSLGELQRELEVVRERAEDREKRTELSLEELETLIAAKEEDTNRRFLEQAQQHKEAINKVHQNYYLRDSVCLLRVQEKKPLRSSFKISAGSPVCTALLRASWMCHPAENFNDRKAPPYCGTRSPAPSIPRRGYTEDKESVHAVHRRSCRKAGLGRQRLSTPLHFSVDSLCT